MTSIPCITLRCWSAGSSRAAPRLAVAGEFTKVRRQIEARLGKRGRREYVQVPRVLENFSVSEVGAAVQQALRFPLSPLMP